MLRAFNRFDLGVIVQDAEPERSADGHVILPLNPFAVRKKVTLGGIPFAGNFNGLIIHPKARNRHFVLGKSAGFIGTNHGRRPERLNGSKTADQGMALDHLSHSQGEADGHNGR